MLQSGSTSVLGRAYGVDEALPLPVPADSRGVVDPLGIPSARRRGGGGGGEKLQGFTKAGADLRWRREGRPGLGYEGFAPLMSMHASIPVDSVGPPRVEVCRTAASFP